MFGQGKGSGRGGCGGQRGGGSCGECVCPQCNEIVPHQPGVPCQSTQCPKCGAAMIRKN